MKWFLFMALIFLTGCAVNVSDNIFIVTPDNNGSINVIGQIESDSVKSSVGNGDNETQVILVSVYDIDVSNIEQVEAYTYGSFNFIRDVSGLWVTEVFEPDSNRLYVVILSYDPLSLQNVSTQGNFSELYQLMNYYNSTTIMTFDPFDMSEAGELVYLEVSDALGEAGVSIVPAISKEVVNATLPVVDCNGQTPVIKFINTNTSASVIYEDACLTISGNDVELVKAANRFIWKFYGVMN